MSKFKDNGKLSVGFVVTHPFHGSMGSILRVVELTQSLSNLGVRCHVYSPYPREKCWGEKVSFHHIPNLASTLGLQNSLYNLTRRALNNPHVMRHIVLKKSILENRINSLTKGLLKAMKDGEVNIIQGEQEIAAVACVRARDSLKVPVVACLHNIWPEELAAMGIINKSSEQYANLEEIEREIQRDSDAVVVVSNEMARYLEQKYSVKKDHIKVVPPGGRPRASKVNTRVKPFKVVYAGLVVSRAHLDLFIKSMPIILREHPDVKFYITRKGEDLPRIRKLAKKQGVNPEYFWFPNNEKFYDFLASCHVGVLPSSNDTPRKLGPAVKLYDYLSVGLPVVANDIGGWTRMIKDEKIGILTEDNSQEFAQGILELLNNQNLARKYGKKGLELIKTKYNWDESARKLLQIYREIL